MALQRQARGSSQPSLSFHLWGLPWEGLPESSPKIAEEFICGVFLRFHCSHSDSMWNLILGKNPCFAHQFSILNL